MFWKCSRTVEWNCNEMRADHKRTHPDLNSTTVEDVLKCLSKMKCGWWALCGLCLTLDAGLVRREDSSVSTGWSADVQMKLNAVLQSVAALLTLHEYGLLVLLFIVATFTSRRKRKSSSVKTWLLLFWNITKNNYKSIY